jgi:outer membrane protein OmpA-like peptidoglycan-associated protein
MKHKNARKVADLGVMSLLILSFSGAHMFAQEKIKGMIKGRSGNTVMLENADQPYVNVLVTDSTKVRQNEGLFKARKKDLSVAALIPGLEVSVEGSRDETGIFVAKSITFNGNDLERAYSIQAGLAETEARSKENEARSQANKEEAARHAAELEKQNAALQAQNAALQKQQAALAEHDKKIAANKALIEANTARFGQLDDYYIYDEVTVLFGNGKFKVEPMYVAPLTNLAEKAITVEGYMIEVKGYASASGSVNLNQKLSQERAAAVSQILLQQGHVPLSRMLAPGAMGESQAKEVSKPADEAEDRKVVVRVLQNKGVAGIK